jgi:hypothetical protein
MVAEAYRVVSPLLANSISFLLLEAMSIDSTSILTASTTKCKLISSLIPGDAS